MRLFILLAVITALTSCSDESKPDISNIKIDLSIQRFDKDFFSIDTNRITTELDRIYKKYPAFLPEYFEFFSPVNFIIGTQGKAMPEAVKEYYANIRPLYDSVEKSSG